MQSFCKPLILYIHVAILVAATAFLISCGNDQPSQPPTPTDSIRPINTAPPRLTPPALPDETHAPTRSPDDSNGKDEEATQTPPTPTAATGPAYPTHAPTPVSTPQQPASTVPAPAQNGNDDQIAPGNNPHRFTNKEWNCISGKNPDWQMQLTTSGERSKALQTLAGCVPQYKLVLFSLTGSASNQGIFPDESLGCINAGPMGAPATEVYEPEDESNFQALTYYMARMIAYMMEISDCIPSETDSSGGGTNEYLTQVRCLSQSFTKEEILLAAEEKDAEVLNQLLYAIEACEEGTEYRPAPGEPQDAIPWELRFESLKRAEGLAMVLDEAKIKASEYLNAEGPWDVDLIRLDHTSWGDSSMGCPKADHGYAQAQVDGFIAVYQDTETQAQARLHIGHDITRLKTAKNIIIPNGCVTTQPQDGRISRNLYGDGPPGSGGNLIYDPHELPLVQWIPWKWGSGCRGCSGEAQECTDGIVPGYIAIFEHEPTGKTIRVHIDEGGTNAFIPDMCTPYPDIEDQ